MTYTNMMVTAVADNLFAEYVSSLDGPGGRTRYPEDLTDEAVRRLAWYGGEKTDKLQGHLLAYFTEKSRAEADRLKAELDKTGFDGPVVPTAKVGQE